MHLSISWLNTEPPADATSDLPAPTRKRGKLKCWNSRPRTPWMKGANYSRSTNGRSILIWWSEFGSNRKRAAHLLFLRNSKTIVTDHQPLSSGICAVAFSPAHANLIVR